MKGVLSPTLRKPPPPAPRQAGARILVVDDDPDMRALLRRQLEGAGYQVAEAEDAVAAGHAVVANRPDLIVADCKMPYMSGTDFIGALRADETIPDLPVVFLTAAQNVNELAGRTFGFPLLTKPAQVDDLLAAVESQFHRA